jgi:cytochrome c
MQINAALRLLTGAAILTSLAACGGDKPKETAAAPEATAPAAPAAPAEPTVAADPAVAAAEAAATPAPAEVTYASLTGNAANGEKLFAVCKTCHVAEKGVNRVGPSLWGVVGRKAGTVEGFKYSPANKNSGITWTEDNLFQYLAAPQKFMPGTYMAYAGMKPPQDRADLIAYLKTKA